MKASKPKPQTRRNLKSKALPALDLIDRQILRLLQDDARKSYSDIGRAVHLSQPAVVDRVRRMEDAGVITGYHASVDPTLLGFPLLAFIRVECKTLQETYRLIDMVREMPEVLEAHRITGEDGLIMRVVAASIRRLDEIIIAVAEISGPSTNIVLGSDIPRRTL
jgi:Lrp/AsnC family transcriptional regulator, leucine-responsive regulatory protein